MRFSLFFDHLPTYGYVLASILLIIYLIKICDSYILLTTYPPRRHNVICERPLIGMKVRNTYLHFLILALRFFFHSKFQSRSDPILIILVTQLLTSSPFLAYGVVHKLRYAFEVGGWSAKYNYHKL